MTFVDGRPQVGWIALIAACIGVFATTPGQTVLWSPGAAYAIFLALTFCGAILGLIGPRSHSPGQARRQMAR